MRRTLSLATTLLFASAIFSQNIHFSAKDGTTADVEMISVNPDEGRNHSIYLGLFGPEGMNLIGFSKYAPTQYYVNLMAGASGGNVDASIFFFSKTKNSKIRQSIKAEGRTRYVGDLPLEKRTSYGFHGGAGYVDYTFFGIMDDNSYSTMSAFAGLSLLTAKHVNLVIDGNDRRGKRNGTAIFRLNADVIYYFNQKLVAGKYEQPDEDETIADATRNIGFRIYVDGKSTAWGRSGRLGINYMLGIGRNSNKKENFTPFAGFGFGYNF